MSLSSAQSPMSNNSLMTTNSLTSFASNQTLATHKSFQSFSDFSEYNNDFELGNDWGFYEDIEPANCSVNNYKTIITTPKELREKYGVLDLSIPSFKHESKMQQIANSLEKRIPLLERRSMLQYQEEKDDNELGYSQYLSNRVIFTTFIIAMLILK
jgi:hypothetical protein